MRQQFFLWAMCAALGVLPLYGREFFVDAAANKSDDGTAKAPFRTIQRAANLAYPGDIFMIADGRYRE